MVEMAGACDGRLTRKPSIDLLDAISAHDHVSCAGAITPSPDGGNHDIP